MPEERITGSRTYLNLSARLTNMRVYMATILICSINANIRVVYGVSQVNTHPSVIQLGWMKHL